MAKPVTKSLYQKMNDAVDVVRGKKSVTAEVAPDYDTATLVGGSQMTAWGLSEFQNPDTLVEKQGLIVYKKMMTDAVVAQTINDLRFNVISADWDVLPVESGNAEFERHAAFTKWTMENMSGSIVGAVFGIMEAVPLGYSISEMVFDVIQGGEWNGLYGLSKIKSKNPEDYDLILDEFANLTGLKLDMTSGAQKDLTAEMWKFIFYSHNPEYGRPWGQSVLRPAYKHWWSKGAMLKWWNMYLETHGMPTRVGKYPAGDTTTAKQDALLKILRAAQANTALIVPDDMELEFMEPAKNGGVAFLAAVGYHDEQIVRAVLGQTLTSSEGKRVGSMALGNVHQEVREDWVTALRKSLEELIRERIIRELMRLNFPAGVPLPVFKWQPRKGKVTIASVSDIKFLLETGLVTEGDVNRLRGRLDLPPSDAFDDKSTEPMLLPKPGGEPGAFSQPEPDGAFSQPEPDGERSDYAATRRKLANLTDAELTESEKRLGGVSYYKQQKRKFIAAEQGLVDTLAPIMKDMLTATQKLVKQRVLKPAGNVLAADHKALNKLQLPPGLLSQLNKEAKSWIDELTNDEYIENLKAVDANSKGIPDVSEFARLDVTPNPGTPVEAVAQMEKWKAAGDWKKIKAWRAKRLADLGGTHETMSQFWITDVVDVEVLKGVKGEIIAGIQNFKGEQGIMEGIKAVFVKYGADAALTDPARLRTIARTNSTRAINDARRLAFQDPDILEAFPATMFSAILDDRTSPQCTMADGHIAPVDDAVWNSLTPPLHHNCRSIIVPVLADEFKETGTSKAPDLTIIDKEFGGTREPGQKVKPVKPVKPAKPPTPKAPRVKPPKPVEEEPVTIQKPTPPKEPKLIPPKPKAEKVKQVGSKKLNIQKPEQGTLPRDGFSKGYKENIKGQTEGKAKSQIKIFNVESFQKDFDKNKIAIKDALKNIPDKDMYGIGKIQVGNEPSLNQAARKMGVWREGLRNSAGFYVNETGDIIIKTQHEKKRRMAWQIKSTIRHEVGHNVFHNRITPLGQKTFEVLSRDIDKKITEYANTSAKEHFSEAYSWYHGTDKSRAVLKSKEPIIFKFINELDRWRV